MKTILGSLLGGMLVMGLAFAAGCNQSPPAETAASGETTTDPLTVSINSRDEDDEDDEDMEGGETAVAEPEPGTPEWHVREILRVRLMPYPTKAKQDGEKTASTTDPDDEPDLAQQAAVQKERNLKVIDLAKQAIALTHKNPDKEMVFNAAVHHLLDARLQLALAGDQEDVDALYQIADALQQSKPKSEVAAAAALTIVNFSHANAVRYAQTEPKWIQEFARQAQLFAGRVSEGLAALSAEETESPPNNYRAMQLKNDASRAAQILMAAGQSCDAAGFPDDGKACYLMIKSKFPETPQAQQVAGIVRRLNLKGQPLQLAGPTLDGNFLSIEDFKGKTVLVVFWSSQAKPFVDQLPALTELLKRAQKHVAVIGVNLDTDESQLDAFLEDTGLAWPQIFHSEPDKRGWGSPAANYYGITTLPTVWIVDPTGVVAETNVAAAELEPKLREVVRRSLKSTKTPGSENGGVVPAGNTDK